MEIADTNGCKSQRSTLSTRRIVEDPAGWKSNFAGAAQKQKIFIFSAQLLGIPELNRDKQQTWQIYKGNL